MAAPFAFSLLVFFVYLHCGVTQRIPDVYSVEASIDPKTMVLSVNSTLDDGCHCRVNQDDEFQCADGDKLDLPCGTYSIFLLCRPLQYETIEAILLFRVSVTCSDSSATPKPQSQLRCSLTVRNSNATLKCSGANNPEMLCSLDSGSYSDYSQSFSPEGFILEKLSCGQHTLTCNSSSLGSNSLDLNFTVDHTAMALPQPFRASMVDEHCSARLTLTPPNLVTCTCVLDSGSRFQCENGTVIGEELSVGRHVVSLDCCTLPGARCEVRRCVKRDIAFPQCPCEPFSANVTTTGSDISLTFSPLSSAYYQCLLYNATRHLVVAVDNCTENQIFPLLLPGRYSLIVVCHFPSAPTCNRNASIPDIFVVTPEPAIQQISTKRINSNLHVEFRANCLVGFYLCRLNTSNHHGICTSPYMIDLTSITFGVYAFEVIAVCEGGLETKPSQLVFEYKSDDQIGGDPCSVDLELVISGNRMRVNYTELPRITIQCRVDQKNFVPCSNGTLFEGLRVGTHSFEANVACDPNNILNISRNFDVAPRPCHGQNIRSVSVAGPVNGILSFPFTVGASLDTTCSFNGAQPVHCSSPYMVDVSNFCSGKYTFVLEAFCNDQMVATSRGTITLTRQSEPPSCQGLNFSCVGDRLRSRRQLLVTCTASEGVTACSAAVAGRDSKELHHLLGAMYRRKFRNAASVRSFRVECRNGSGHGVTKTFNVV